MGGAYFLRRGIRNKDEKGAPFVDKVGKPKSEDRGVAE